MDIKQLKGHALPIRCLITGTLTHSQLKEKYDPDLDPNAKFSEPPHYVATIANPQIIPGSLKDANGNHDQMAQEYLEGRFKTSVNRDGVSTVKYWGKSKSNWPTKVMYDPRLTGIETFPPLSAENHDETTGDKLENELASGLKVTLSVTIFDGYISPGSSFDAVMLEEPVRYYSRSGSLENYLASQGITKPQTAPVTPAPAAQVYQPAPAAQVYQPAPTAQVYQPALAVTPAPIAAQPVAAAPAPADIQAAMQPAQPAPAPAPAAAPMPSPLQYTPQE